MDRGLYEGPFTDRGTHSGCCMGGLGWKGQLLNGGCGHASKELLSKLALHSLAPGDNQTALIGQVKEFHYGGHDILLH